MKRLILAALTAALLALPASAHASRVPTWMTCGYEGETQSAAGGLRDCFAAWPNLSMAEAISLHNLSWTGWGNASAYARGRTRVKTNEPWIYVRVRAHGLRACGNWGRAYTRLTVSGIYRTHTWRLPGCSQISPPDY
jgi:hypothetical protein